MEKTIEDRLIEASCIADSISAISYCIGQTDASLEWEDCKRKVFRGLEKLGEVLSDELTAVCCDIHNKEGVII